MKKEKQSNFELLRIVAMLMIIIFHSLVNFVGTRDSQYISNNIELGGVLLMLRYVFGQLGVIFFAMISGYFLINAREKKNPFERAMATAVKFAGMLLYNGLIISAIIAVIYMAVRKLGIVGPVFYELINTTRNIFDDSHLIFGYLGGFWYLSVYFLLLAVINPLNRFLNKLTDNRTFLALIIVVIFISVCLNSRYSFHWAETLSMRQRFLSVIYWVGICVNLIHYNKLNHVICGQELLCSLRTIC